MRRRVSHGLVAVAFFCAGAAGGGCSLHRQPAPTTPMSEAIPTLMQPVLAPWRATLGRPRAAGFVLGANPEAINPRDKLDTLVCKSSMRFMIRSPWAVPGGILSVGLCDSDTELTPERIAAAIARFDAARLASATGSGAAQHAAPRPEDIGNGLEATYLPLVLAGSTATQQLATLIARRGRSGPALIIQLDKEDFCKPYATQSSLLCTNPKQVVVDLALGLAAYL